MSRQLSRDTVPERVLRSRLHARGLRFRLHRRVLPGVRREVDIVFPTARVAVFIDGCFWHGCPQHASWPKSNATWWRDKLERNRRRDADTDEKLKRAGWTVLRFWEHEDPEAAAVAVEAVVRERMSD